VISGSVDKGGSDLRIHQLDIYLMISYCVITNIEATFSSDTDFYRSEGRLGDQGMAYILN
jgi:hypothetical protein